MQKPSDADVDTPYGVMSSIPLAIYALGQLMIIASTVDDVSINHPPPWNGKFNHIKYPDSLRTTLLQISNRGYEAFNKAHFSMMTIHNYSKQIIRSVIDVEKLLKNATTAAVSEFASMRLDRVNAVVKNCQDECSQVIDTLSQLMDLMAEVLEACVNSKLSSERLLQQLKKKTQEMENKERINKLAIGREPSAWTVLVGDLLPLVLGLESAVVVGATQLHVEADRKREEDQLMECDSSCQVDYEDSIVVLGNGALVIEQLRDHWIEFKRICASMSPVNVLDKNKTSKDGGCISSPHLISDSVLRITPISQMIGCITSLYVDISGKYILPAIGGLNEFSVVHPEEMEQMKKQLTESTQTAHNAIEKAIRAERMRLLKNNNEQ